MRAEAEGNVKGLKKESSAALRELQVETYTPPQRNPSWGSTRLATLHGFELHIAPMACKLPNLDCLEEEGEEMARELQVEHEAALRTLAELKQAAEQTRAQTQVSPFAC